MAKRVTAASLKLRVLPAEAALILLEQAVRTVSYPKHWRASEKAMTKATAQESLAIVSAAAAKGEAAELSYFDWSVLLGELAHFTLRKRGIARFESLTVYMDLKKALEANPDVQTLLAAVQATEKAGNDVLAARAQLAFAEEQLKRKEREAALVSDPDPEFSNMTREEGDAKRDELREIEYRKLEAEADAEVAAERAERAEKKG